MGIKGRAFIIDAGHGGKYNGVVYGTRKEKVVNLNMAKILQKKLTAKGATVYMTRTTDKDFGGSTADADINKRVAYINSKFPKVSGLLSIHCNTAWTGRVGPFYQTGKTTSKNFSKAIATRYGTAPHEGNFAILRDTTRTAATTLIELGQINESWLDKTASLESTADFIIKGLEDYFV